MRSWIFGVFCDGHQVRSTGRIDFLRGDIVWRTTDDAFTDYTVLDIAHLNVMIQNADYRAVHAVLSVVDLLNT